MASHLDTVQHERDKYGTPLGEENAWKVTNATAYTHRAEGWGLLEKLTGQNWQGFSIDRLVNRVTKEVVDCLYSSETIGRPQWNEELWEAGFAERWRAPIPPETPEPPPPDDLEARVALLEADLADLRRALSQWIG